LARIESRRDVDEFGDRENSVEYGIIAGLEHDEQNDPDDRHGDESEH
jgi:hypothetical protein